MKKVIVTLFFLLGLVGRAWAIDYYVDCDTGNDANNGLTTGTAFRSTQPVEGTNFLSPGDTVNLKRDCVWSGPTDSIFEIKSAGTAGNFIKIQAYGSGADPMFKGSVDPAIDVPGWGAWVEVDAVNHIWESNVTIPWQVNMVIVDGSYSLSSPFLAFQNQTLLTQVQEKFYHPSAGSKMRVRLRSDADPNTKSIEFARYHTSLGGRGLVKVDNATSQYIEFHDIQTYGSNSFGFTTGNPYIYFIDCTGRFSARENFYFIDNVTNHPSGAAHNLCLRCTADDANTWGHNSQGGAGQNITIEAPYVDIIDSDIYNSWMAGVDWLRYNSDTNPFFGRLINSRVHDNSRRSKTTFDIGGFDPEVYVDGGSDIQIINNEIYKGSGYSSGNASEGIKLGTEYSATYTVENIDIVNNRIYGLNGTCFKTLSMNGGSTTSTPVLSNVRIEMNTCIRGSYYLLTSMGHFITAANGGLGLIHYNNVYSNPAGSFIGYMPTAAGTIFSDYNIYYDLDGEQDIFNDTLSLSEWQSATSQDANSIFSNPLLTNGVHLSNTASGQGSTSPAVNAGIEGRLSDLAILSIGTTRTDNVVDDTGNIDMGYHYNFVIDTEIGFSDPEETVGIIGFGRMSLGGVDAR